MSNILKLSLKNTVAILLLVVLVIASGIYSTNKIKVETFPNVTFPALFVQATYMGHSTQELEEQLTRPIEESIKQQKGYDTLTSTSRNNGATISVNFPYGTDIDKQKTKLEEVIGKIKVPDGAKVEIRQIDMGAQAVYQAAIAADNSSQNAQALIGNDLVPTLEKVDGVGTVTLQGAKTQKISIELNREKAKEYGLDLQTIRDAIQMKNYKVSLGQVNNEGTNIPLEMQGDMKSLKELTALEITVGQPTQKASSQARSAAEQASAQPNNQAGFSQQGMNANLPPEPVKVKLSDIAEIKTITDQTEISRFNGKESYLISVTKTQDANTAEVVRNVKDKITTFKKDNHFTLYTVQDQGKEVESSISSLVKEGGFGVLFAVIVILLFLRNIRATVIAIVSLPLSILSTIALLHQFNYTLNIMTLGGMAVAVGRIIDDSIVVIENIYRWRQEKGQNLSMKEVALHATKEVFGAVTSSTLATLVVFLPLAFVGGIIGEMFRPFALAVVFSISVSLIVAVILIPVLGSIFFKKVKHVEKRSRLAGLYEKLLRGSFRKKGLVMTLSILLLVGSFALIPKLGISFLPADDSNAMQADVTLSSTVSIDQMDAVAKQVESFLKNQPEIDYSQVSIGLSNGRGMQMGGGSSNKIKFFIQLKNGQKVNDVMSSYQKNFEEIVQKDFKDSSVTFSETQKSGPPSGNTIDIQLYSSDLAKLTDASDKVTTMLSKNNQLKNITSNLGDEQVKWQLVISKDGENAGVQYLQLMQAIREYLSPVTVGEYEIDGNTQEVTLSYDKKLSSKADIENIDIKTMEGMKKVSNVATIDEVKVPTTLYHDDGKPLVKVSAVIKGNNTAKVTKEVKKDINSLSLLNGVDVTYGGGLKMIQDGFSNMGIAMGAAIGLVFLVLSVTFGGILTPLVILSSLIFVPIGALGGLLISGQPLSMSALIGMLMLIGVVVTNAVVLLDRVEANRKQGIELQEAIVEAAKTRLRPILMTAFATIFALVPLAMSTSASSGLISKGLAVTVIGGLTTSTLLTLIFVPVLYSLVGKFRKNLGM
ncbi:acriflavin resistance protein [Neobacillus bataviensis LMG 21833]|uniref:Acriflavin resistance protein n=1 Tax=Neobacillus bataviensis LMG 21833 TaxID=1117379 RepID=K6DCY8_9BACI|nr:efflux RND transporter permease subunit [Neobacillus bataviensis]EKN65938.1 acriflavin resistance protein [Neobacillus bataviensis LMG 21833]